MHTLDECISCGTTDQEENNFDKHKFYLSKAFVDLTFSIIMVYFRTHAGSYKLPYNFEGKTTQEYMKAAENLRFKPLELYHNSLSLDN